jgi:glycosyltransferase involved in cell wall biosynthesis
MKIYVLTIHNPEISFGPHQRLKCFLKDAKQHNIEFVLPKFCDPKKHSKLKTITTLLDSFSYIQKNRKTLDTIHVVTPPSYPGVLVAILAKKLFKVKYIVDIGDPYAENMAILKNFSKKSLRFKILKYFDKKLYKHASHLILTSPELTKNIPNTKQNTTILTGLEHRHAITPKQLPNNKKCIYFGNYGPLQKLEYLVEVFANAIRKDPEIKLDIIGTGEREKLEKLVHELEAEENIKFLDPIPSSEIPEMTKEYVCGLVSLNLESSLDYAIPTKLLTSLTLGLPIFGTGGKATKDLVRKAEAGLISTKYNKESDVQALLHLLNSNQTLAAYSKNATSFAKQNLTFENCIKNYKLTLH